MAVVDHKLYKYIEHRLFSYYSLRRAAREHNICRGDIIHRGRASVDCGGKSHHADPTARKGAELAALDHEVDIALRWVRVIEHSIRRYEGTPKGRLLEMRYFEELGEEHICTRLHIERTAYYRWRNEIVAYTSIAAAEAGLVSVLGRKPVQKVRH